jgi:hypothetical protein
MPSSCFDLGATADLAAAIFVGSDTAEDAANDSIPSLKPPPHHTPTSTNLLMVSMFVPLGFLGFLGLGVMRGTTSWK